MKKALKTVGLICSPYGRQWKYPKIYHMHDYMELIFEKMCKEYLMRYADNLPFDLADVGQWWGTDPREKKQIQIDIVGVPVKESNQKIAEYLMGSCKFKNRNSWRSKRMYYLK